MDQRICLNTIINKWIFRITNLELQFFSDGIELQLKQYAFVKF